MILKRGKLYWYEVDAKDIDSFFLVRLFRKLEIDYIPCCVKKCSWVYLGEDISKYSRKLVDCCRLNGVTTIVIEEGARYGKNPFGHSNLHADFFSCARENYEFWKQYIPAGKLRTHEYSKPRELYTGIVFLLPLLLRNDFTHPWFMGGVNTKIMATIEKFMSEDVVFKLHQKNKEFVEKLIPKNRIVEGNAIELIQKYRSGKIYCFDTCSIRKDCELLGVKPVLIDGSLNKKEIL